MSLKPWVEYNKRCTGCGAFLEPHVVNGKRESLRSFQKRTTCNRVCTANSPRHVPDLSPAPIVEQVIDPWLDQQLRKG
jgi:hypothetical protein